MAEHSLIASLDGAIQARMECLALPHESALRLFNGFYEGAPDLVADLYRRTLLLHDYSEQPEATPLPLSAIVEYLHASLPWLQAIVVKVRRSRDEAARRGFFASGASADRRVREHGVWYAVDLFMNRDAGFYIDTRNLRGWAIKHLAGKTVLNTFAYTGSLGVAALAGKARRVVQMDRNRTFLNTAKTSYSLNGFAVDRSALQTGDFFSLVSAMKRSGTRFDCVFVDPPFFSTTGKGRVDLENDSARLINKVRPLINDGGCLVAVNNALFVSGADYLRTLEGLCADGCLAIEELISVPQDITGYPATIVNRPPVDPAPFNHPTKIVVLRVRRK